MYIIRKGASHCVLLVLLLTAANIGVAQGREDVYKIATGTISGTYFPVFTAIASTVSATYDSGISFVAIKSEGSVQNADLVRKGEAQFAVLQGWTAYQAWTGSGPFSNSGKIENMRTVMVLWQDIEQFLIFKEYSGKGDVSDLQYLKGRNVAFGHPGSGARETSIHILSALGYNFFEDFINNDDVGYPEAVDSLIRREVVGVALAGGVPVSAVARAFTALGTKIVMLSFSEQQRNKVNEEVRLWSRAEIGPGSYQGMPLEPVQSIGQPVLLVTTEDVSQEVVYKFLEEFFKKENLDKLKTAHQVVEHMTKDIAAPSVGETSLPPAHRGAVRFFESASGLK